MHHSSLQLRSVSILIDVVVMLGTQICLPQPCCSYKPCFTALRLPLLYSDSRPSVPSRSPVHTFDRSETDCSAQHPLSISQGGQPRQRNISNPLQLQHQSPIVVALQLPLPT